MWRKNIARWYAIALEADAVNVKKTKDNLEAYGIHHVNVIHGSLGSSSGNMRINNCRDDNELNLGLPIKLDGVPWEKPPTYIKMDIEGAELSVLKEAVPIISKYLPKLAVCLYHSTSDLVMIPLHIIKNHPEYKIYIRHHRSGSLWETVCYGLPFRAK
jgi:hypothetical protein